MRLLIVGQLNGYIGTASKMALNRGAQITHVDDCETALKMLRSGKGADILLIDVQLDVGALVRRLSEERFNIPVVACGIGTDSSLAVNAIKAGAKEYLPLPPEAELIAAVLETVSNDDDTLIYRDPVMKKTLKLAEQIAPSDASVLITGESGTGKEMMARFIHRRSRRKSKPFISVNCAAIPENLLESELFGYEKGAFTGAVARRIGKFEEASGGTFLLDEISEMHPMLQAKLLRAIQEREIDRIGGVKPVKVDIRILATSNRNLEEEVRKGTFREDLYFRLNVVNLEIPPLRERVLDVEPLADYFVEKYTKVNGLKNRRLSAAALEALRRHSWRGNVRELENTIHRSVLLSTEEEISIDVIQLSGVKSILQETEEKKEIVGSPLVGRTVADVERDLIIGTLSHCLGNRTQAASILGISIRTLRNKLKQYSESETEKETSPKILRTAI